MAYSSSATFAAKPTAQALPKKSRLPNKSGACPKSYLLKGLLEE
jgi:hypothetical protein